MKKEEFEKLQEGDIVCGKLGDGSLSGMSFIVTANYGGRVIAVRTVDLTNPVEWELLRKSSQIKNVD